MRENALQDNIEERPTAIQQRFTKWIAVATRATGRSAALGIRVVAATAAMLGAIAATAIPPAARAEEPIATLPAWAPQDPSQIAAPVGTAFTYQGKLDRSGLPTNTLCNFLFSLWDAPTGGNQIGSTQTVNGVTTTDGLFSVQLDFGSGAFGGQARWLEISLLCTGDGQITTLAPRQPITPAPYAMFALGGSAALSLPYSGSTDSPSQDGFMVTNTAASTSVSAIHGRSSANVFGGTGAVFGEATATSGPTLGIYGLASASSQGTGAVGKGGATGGYFEALSPGGTGAYGIGSGSGTGLYGSSGSGTGIQGESSSGWGMFARSTSNHGAFGQALGNNAAGILGRCEGTTGQGVFGYSPNGATGVWGVAEQGDGVVGQTNAASKSGVYGSANQASSYGGFFANFAGGVALKADGRAQVKVLEILGADLVEKFQSRDEAPEPGTVMVIDGEEPGAVKASSEPYDRRVAGVVSGAGGIPHGIHLGQGGALDGNTPIAMTGRVYVKCTTENGAIRPGDRLTTSSRRGSAMRATDVALSDGAVLGKAITALESGTGLVLVLVNLQ